MFSTLFHYPVYWLVIVMALRPMIENGIWPTVHKAVRPIRHC